MKQLLTVKEYAEKKSLSNSTIYKYIKNGKVQSETKNGRKFIIDNDSGDIFEIENIIEPIVEDSELDFLRRRVQELETVSELASSLIAENRKLKDIIKDNQKLIPLKKDKIIELSLFLINSGFTKDKRTQIIKNFKKQDSQERIIKKDKKIYLDFDKYSYKDLL